MAAEIMAHEDDVQGDGMPDFPDPVKGAFLKYLSEEASTLGQAAAKVSIDPKTVWNWRQRDPAFDAAVKRAKLLQGPIRLEAVEDTLLSRILGERASPAEIIFWLKKHSPEWRMADQVGIHHTGAVAHGVLVKDITDLSDAELFGIINEHTEAMTDVPLVTDGTEKGA